MEATEKKVRKPRTKDVYLICTITENGLLEPISQDGQRLEFDDTAACKKHLRGGTHTGEFVIVAVKATVTVSVETKQIAKLS